MKSYIRRSVVAFFLCGAVLALVAAPALGQVEPLYTGVNPPVVGGVLASSGQRSVDGQVLALQVTGGGVAGAQQARVEGLAFTGADIATMVLIGVSALALGVVLTGRARARSTSTT